ncbi:hypothetical protein [Streptomyces syringium]|uniref:hypothetical protein n=1 Tax=Streptomyces syringium TaxID=76729 RepID=UPI003AAA25CB
MWSAVTAALPFVTGPAFDAVLKNGSAADSGEFHAVVAGLVLLVLVRGVSGIAAPYSLETFACGLERDARAEVFGSLLGKSQGFFNR